MSVNVLGKSLKEAEDLLKAAEVNYITFFTFEGATLENEGLVIKQETNDHIPLKNYDIQIHIANLLIVPALGGATIEKSKQVILDSGFSIGEIVSAETLGLIEIEDESLFRVVDQFPKPGTRQELLSEINLIVAS